MVELPRIGITMGDPAGIGPEVVVKAWQEPELARRARRLVIGDPGVMEATAAALAPELEVRRLDGVADARYAPRLLEVLAPELPDLAGLEPGRVQARAGAAAARCVEAAVALALAGELDAICTAPINKLALREAGIPYHGHTEMLRHLTGARETALLLTSDVLTCIHVTGHVGLRAACGLLTPERIGTVVRLGQEVMVRLGRPGPRIAVAGLNPHAGEEGLFGREDAELIAPAVTTLAQEGYRVTGPVPPDVVFRQAAEGAYDLVVAMYHDQGHIPMKLLNFQETVAVTPGLPIIRTSVDHGTAFDIAGQGVADPANMLAALRMAVRLAGGPSGGTPGAPAAPA